MTEVITGTVVDHLGNPLSSVNIFFPKEEIGTTTNNKGFFKIDFPFKYPVTVDISHIGFQKERIIIQEKITDNLLIELKKLFIEMDELVVTATRTKKVHKDVPIATQVINKSEILRSGTTNVAELLSQRSGVSLQTSVEGGSVLNLLGLDSRYILILIDGQPVNGKFNNRVSLDQIHTKNINKIEIVKGPSSSLYGSEAMAGVINILTDEKVFSRSYDFSIRGINSENKLRTDGLGSGSGSLNFKINQPLKRLNLSINANANKIKTDKTIELIEVDQINRYYFEMIFSTKDYFKNDLSLKFNVFDQSDNGNSKLMVTNTNIERYNYFLTHSVGSFTQTVSSSSYKRNYVQKRPWGQLERDDLTTEKYLEYEGLFNKKIGKHDFNSGIEIHKATYASDRIKDGRQIVFNNSFFAQSSFDFNEKLNLIVGLRNDNYSEYNSVVNPRVGAMYTLNGSWKLRTAWGKGFRAPSFMERFIDWNHTQFNYTVLGNVDLRPETSNGTTFGIEYTNPVKYQASITFYHTNFDNLINDFVIEPGKLSYQNIESATFSGIEILHNQKISESLNSGLSINYIDNRDNKNNIIPNTMPLSINSNISYRSEKSFNSTISIKWIAPYTPQEYDPTKGIFVKADDKLNDYAVINVVGSKKFKNYYNFQFGLNNLTNYTNNRFGPFLGRSAFIEFSTIIN